MSTKGWQKQLLLVKYAHTETTSKIVRSIMFSVHSAHAAEVAVVHVLHGVDDAHVVRHNGERSPCCSYSTYNVRLTRKITPKN